MKQAISLEHSNPISDKSLQYFDGMARRECGNTCESVSQRDYDGEKPKHHEQGKRNQ